MLLNVTGGFNLGGGTENEAPIFTTDTFTIGDDLTMIRGSHQFGFGGQVAFWESLSLANVRSPGTYTFDGGVTGIGLVDFMVGRPFTFIQSAPNTLDIKQKYFGLYGQDTWKLSPTMTLNYGVRWEPWFPQQHQNGAVYNFSPDRFRAGTRSTVFPQAPPGFTYPGDEGFPNGKAGMHTDWLNVAPRVGIAWDPERRRPYVGSGRVRHERRVRQRAVLHQRRQRAAVGLGGASDAAAHRPLRGSVPRHRRDEPVPGHVRRQRAVLAERPVHLGAGRISTRRACTRGTSASSDRSATNTAVSASYIGNYTTNLWDVVTGNPGTIPAGASPTGPCTLNTPTGPQTFANCSAAPLDMRREITQLGSGGRPLHRVPRLLHRLRPPAVQRAAAPVPGSRGQRTEPQRELHAVEVRGPSVGRRRHRQRRQRVHDARIPAQSAGRRATRGSTVTTGRASPTVAIPSR